MANNPQERILILAPVGQDAAAMARLLQTNGLAATVCGCAAEACTQLKEGAGALLMTEEALELAQAPQLFGALNQQPPWAELPLIMLTRGGESRLARLLNVAAEAAGSLTLLERPIGEATLLRSVEVALRSRRRQYQVRDLLEEQRIVQGELRESEERLRLAMAAAHMGAWEMDLRSGALVWDARQAEMFGRSPQTAPRTIEQFYLLLHPLDAERLKRAIDATPSLGKLSEEFRLAPKDGAVRWIAGHGVIVNDRAGRPARIVGLNYDITDNKASRARLEQFAEELERQVSERTRELVSSQTQLRAMATELNLAEQRERKRMAVELHDHLAQMLVLVRLKLGQAKQGPVFRSIEMIKQAEDVVNDALTYTRNLVAELSPPVLHEFGLIAALRWLAEQMQRYQLHVSVRIDATEDVRLPEDQAVLVFQSVRELLINAVKHAVAKHASLTVEEQDGSLRIVVQDQGVGFDLLAMATQQPSPMSSKFGLFSIRERMNALGGRLELHSAPGEGTRATLILPRSPRQQAAAHTVRSSARCETPAQPSEGRPNGPCRVVIADDHAMVRQGLRSVLEGFPDVNVVGEASNGQEAVDLTEQLKPSAVVMDINMPCMNGIEATAKIKTRHPDVVVIGMSVNASSDNHDAMRTAGASMLLTKEAAVDQLYGAIQRAVAIGPTGIDALERS